MGVKLIAVSVMAPVFDPLYRGVIEHLSTATGQRIDLLEDVPWPVRESMLRTGRADLGFICGLPYIEEADRRPPTLGLLGAPVMAAPRYRDRAQYFSDVVVPADSPHHGFADLEGGTWAYNEPSSHSGCNVARWYLASRGLRHGYFGRVVESGSHENTLRLLERGAIDGSAIDSTVLERVLELEPALRARIRVIETLGPSPMPPVVVGRHVSAACAARLRAALLSMPAAALRPFGVTRFAAMEDRDYDPIRVMTREAGTTPFVRVSRGHGRPVVESA